MATHAAASMRRARSTWHGVCKWLIVHRDVLDRNPIDFHRSTGDSEMEAETDQRNRSRRNHHRSPEPSPTARTPWPELERALCAIFVGAVSGSAKPSHSAPATSAAPHCSARHNATGKGDKTRTVRLPPEVVTFVDTYLADRLDERQSRTKITSPPKKRIWTNRFGKFRNTDPLFVRVNGEPRTTKVIDYLVTGWFLRAGTTPPTGALGHSLLTPTRRCSLNKADRCANCNASWATPTRPPSGPAPTWPTPTPLDHRWPQYGSSVSSAARSRLPRRYQLLPCDSYRATFTERPSAASRAQVQHLTWLQHRAAVAISQAVHGETDVLGQGQRFSH